MPHALTAEQWEQLDVLAKGLLEMIAHDSNFLDSIITGDKSWHFSYDLERKRQSAARCRQNSPRLNKLKFQKPKIKTTLILFFDSRGVVHQKFVPERHTVNVSFYCNVLDHLSKPIARVRLDLWKS